MITLRKISEKTLAKGSVLTHQQMSKVVGGGCYIRCDQDIDVEKNPDAMVPVENCSKENATRACGGNLDKVICGGGAGC